MRPLIISLLLSAGCFAGLPDPLMQADGTKITTKEQWEKSLRAETLRKFRENIYGVTPVGKPEGFKAVVTKEVPDALDGAATVKFIEISFNTPKGERKIRPVVVLPNKAEKPTAAFLLINNRKPDLLDPDNPNGFFPVREIVARGYAAVGFHYGDVDVDKKDGYQGGVRFQYDPEKPADDAWACVAAWAWGASRVLDYIGSEPRIDAKKVAVVGHSRGGKTALWAGAEDPRFALVISNDSGCTGAAISRGKVGESVKKINELFPHWFNTNYKKFGGKEDELPVDQHQLVALIAPRHAYVASAIEDTWADPKSEFRSCVEAAPVYALYGMKTTGTAEFPAIGTPLHTGQVGYHVRAGNHDLKLVDWQNFMDFADLKGFR
ncbi:alpha/beta hydrolase-fold protein [Luteolibacter sp. SL250]|uniref:dienelactone hydrolase family protein n=1 Tax=Luteolibacter sp. SL250 TaxID=2995170 RepID=UPI0022720B67|nr:alpha/beta hydrolase-fold protein [Luteolibacter sp. SL250]WAC19174.1 alpha/beta hydrolase-fold protein [Luteolibacter sp. SL250]